MPEQRPHAMPAGDNCAFIRAQRDYEAGMLRRVNRIVLALSVVTACCIGALATSATFGHLVTAAASGVGVAVSGLATKFILAQRADHQARIAEWVEMIERLGCPDTT